MKKAMFVTGGTVGTGFATAEKFAENGYAVIITSRKEEKLPRLQRKYPKSTESLPKATVLTSETSRRSLTYSMI